MKVKMQSFVYVTMEADVDTTDEDFAFEEASGRFYDGLNCLIKIEPDVFNWCLDTGLDMEVVDDACDNESCEDAD